MANNWQINAIAGLDGTQSRNQLNSDIKGLARNLDKLKLYAEIDKNQVTQLQHQLKNLQVQLNNVTVSDAVINGLVAKINAGLQNVNIENINAGNVSNQAQQVGQQIGNNIGQQITQSISSAIQKGTMKGADGQKDLSKYIPSGKLLQNDVAKEALKDFQALGVGIVTVKEEMKNIDGKNLLNGFTINIKNAKGEVESLRYALTDIEGKTGKMFQYVGGSINDNGVIQQMNAISSKADSLQTKLDKLKANYSDLNASRPIKDSGNISALSQQHDKVAQAIENVRNADNSTFTSMVSNAQKEITTLETMVTQFRNAENVATQMKSVDISSGIAQAQERLGKLKANASGFEQMTETIRKLDTAIEGVGDKASLDAFINDLRTAETQLSRVKAEAKQLENVNKIQLLFDNGHGDSIYGNRIKQIENDFVKYGLSVDEASQKTQTLRNILNGFKDTDGNFLPDDKLVAQANKLETEFKAVKVSVDSAKLSYDKFLQPVSSDKASSLIIRINDFLTKNTAITKEAKEELLGFIRLLQNGNVNLSDWNKFDTRLKEINQEMRVAGKLGKGLKQTLIDGAKSFAQWTLSSGAVMEVWNGFKQGIRNVKELDDSLVELNKVTDLTVESLSKVTEESFELGEKLAKTGTKVLDSVTSFSRAGYNIEDSMKYAEEALKTTNISENLKDAGQAADSLVNIMKGFQDETPEFAKKINDSVNQVSNTEAVDFDNLIDGATRLSAVADQAGMSFEQMLGTLTGAYEVLGNMEKVANGQITIFTRLQAIQMEGEEEVSTVAKLQDKFSNATNGAVNIVDKTTGQLRNVYDILDDLSDVWDTLDKNTQEALAFEAAGTRQKNVFLSMMQNWQGVEDAVKSAENSIGSADEENQAYLNSLSGKLEDLESALQHISKTLIDSNLLKFFVDLGTTGVKSVDALIESLSPLGTLLTIGSGIAGAKGLGLTNYVTTIIVYESLFRKRYNNAISPT